MNDLDINERDGKDSDSQLSKNEKTDRILRYS
jgi:hypothetical protein